jgi:hypothetical protein
MRLGVHSDEGSNSEFWRTHQLAHTSLPDYLRLRIGSLPNCINRLCGWKQSDCAVARVHIYPARVIKTSPRPTIVHSTEAFHCSVSTKPCAIPLHVE